jgi:hypothetical protein
MEKAMKRLFMPGDRVEIRPADEILATLDADGMLEGLPFMPEMVPFCGQEFRVWRRIEQTCVESGGGGIRRIGNVVALNELRCDGSAHDKCDRCCVLLWKEQWLKPANQAARPPASTDTVRKLLARLRTRIDGGRYLCQSTRLQTATTPYAKWDGRRLYRGALYRGGGVSDLVQFALLPVLSKVRRLLERPLSGRLPRTPSVSLNLQPGDRVEVKSLDEIKTTLDAAGKNRGLAFTIQMLPFCGGRFTVKRRIARMIDEDTGLMKELKDTVLLDGVTCDGHTRVGGCPREVYHFWRETWLRPVRGEPTQ